MELIVNVNKSWGIGKEGKLLCSFPEDMQFFRDITANKTVIVGRKTLEGFYKGIPLPHRTNIVITNSRTHISEQAKENCDYYAYMKRLKKHDDILLTGVRCKNPESKEQRDTKLIVAENIFDVADIANFITTNPKDIIVCGGAEIYKFFLPYCDKCYVTVNDCEYEADTFFPVDLFKDENWKCAQIPSMEYLDKYEIYWTKSVSKPWVKYAFLTFNRKK